MNPSHSSDPSIETLLALRRENDAVRIITERLRVKEMGPADHIRTKHEVKAFVESGDTKIAEELLNRACERRANNQSMAMKIAQQRGQRMRE